MWGKIQKSHVNRNNNHDNDPDKLIEQHQGGGLRGQKTA